MESHMNDGEGLADYFEEEEFALDEFEAEMARREHEEASGVDRWVDDEQTNDYE